MMKRLAPRTLICIAAALIGCHDRDSARVADKPLPIHQQDTAGKSTLEPGALATVATAPVTNWKGPGGKPFEVTVRTVDPVSSTSRKFGTITLRT
ncbi:MAG TPA: hypothetical protein VFT21_03025, partial [Gemmatimonadaceae bacterium]|nr:hypothetical protein [Gemmatimonadaceae bacterium]